MAKIIMRRSLGMLAVAVLASCGGGSGTSADSGANSQGGGGKGGDAGAGSDAGAGGQAASGCAAVAACGGAVIGTWKITDSCVTLSLDLGSTCSGATATVALSFSGAATYNADLTYTQTGTAGGTAHYHFPRSCIGTQTCAQVQADLLSADSATAVGMTFESATCASEGTGCACDAVMASASANEAGTYNTSSNTLTTVHDGNSDSAPYCVSGSIMHQMAPTGAGATGAIVLTKS